MDDQKLKRIMIFRLSALGDVVMMLPLVNVLQSAYPNAEITWVTTPLMYDLLQGLPGVRFQVVEKPRGVLGWLRLCWALRAEAYDLCIAAQASWRAHSCYPFIRARRLIGWGGLRAKDGHRWFVSERIPFEPVHLVDAFLGFARYLGLDATEPTWHLPLASADHEDVDCLAPGGGGPLIVINPMASRPERTWALARYVALLDEIAVRWGCSVVLIGGPSAAEYAFSEAIAQQVQSPPRVLTGKLSLKQTAALLARATVLISPDTGPAHMAVAVGTPVVGLYAVAPSAWCGPYGSPYTVDVYEQAVSTYLNQAAKRLAWGERVHHPEAMSLIAIDQVLAQLKKVLNESSQP
jgi:heptosyltransferase I